MLLTDLLNQNGMSKYSLSKHSGVPDTTLNDICRSKMRLEKCGAETVCRLAQELHVPMEELLEFCMDTRCTFELFKSNVCHKLICLGDMDFLAETLEHDKILAYYRN